MRSAAVNADQRAAVYGIKPSSNAMRASPYHDNDLRGVMEAGRSMLQNILAGEEPAPYSLIYAAVQRT